MLAHGCSLNQEMGRIKADIDYEYKNASKEKAKPYIRVNNTYKVFSSENEVVGPVMKKMSAKEYREFMGAQGVHFGKVITNA